MTEREALRLALKALEIGLPLIEDFGSTEQLNAQHKAITAIYEALAQPEQKFDTHSVPGKSRNTHSRQPEQEPVAWIDKMVIDVPNQLFYTAPHTWVGLTDEEKASFWTADQMTEEEWQQLFAAIEAKLKEKNCG